MIIFVQKQKLYLLTYQVISLNCKKKKINNFFLCLKRYVSLSKDTAWNLNEQSLAQNLYNFIDSFFHLVPLNQSILEQHRARIYLSTYVEIISCLHLKVCIIVCRKKNSVKEKYIGDKACLLRTYATVLSFYVILFVLYQHIPRYIYLNQVLSITVHIKFYDGSTLFCISIGIQPFWREIMLII